MSNALVPGVHQFDAAAYHADPCSEPSLSSSIAQVLIDKSPRHAWLQHPRLNPAYKPDEDSRFDLGSAAHALLLEGANAKIAVIDAADWRTKGAKEQRDQARASGLFPILAKHDYALKAMVKAAHEAIEESELKGIFQDGKPEQTVIWREAGVWLRCRPDWLANDHRIILDYKTAENAEPEQFSRQIERMGYDFQAAFYSRSFPKPPAFIFLAQEIEPPYDCSLHGLSEAAIQIAAFNVERAINIWRGCMIRGKWPGYDKRIHYAEPTTWALQKHEQRLQEAE